MISRKKKILEDFHKEFKKELLEKSQKLLLKDL